jgi:hypothetical protein
VTKRRPNPDTQRTFRARVAAATRRIAGPAPKLTAPTTTPMRTPGSTLRRVPARVGDRTIDRDEAKRIASSKDWAKGARYIGMFRCWHCFEVVP